MKLADLSLGDLNHKFQRHGKTTHIKKQQDRAI